MLLRLARFFSSMLSQFLKKLVALHYGQGVEKPVFALRNYCLVSKATQTHRQMGKQQEHIKLFGRFADAVGFQLAEAYQSLGCPSTVDLLGSIGENTFRGVTSLQFQFHAIQASQEPLLP